MVYIMSVPGRIEAIRNIVKWSARDDWASCCEQVFGEHLDPIADKFDMTSDEISKTLGDAFSMLYGVMLEDFFTARFGDNSERNVIDDYIKRRGWRETVSAKRYLTAVRDSVISLYEVVDLVPGRSMTVRDMIRGGDPVTVEEKLGSESAARWDRIAARIVRVNKNNCFTGGMLPVSYESSSRLMTHFEEMEKVFRTNLRREAKKLGDSSENTPQAVKVQLLQRSGARFFTQAWLIDALGRIQAPLPEMYNSDGDKILFSVVRFPVTGDEAKLITVIDGIENIERNEPEGASWTWLGRGSPSQRIAISKGKGFSLQTVDASGRTSLGSIEVKSRSLLLSTNSQERAERGRDLLLSHLGTLVGTPLTSHEAIERALERTKSPQRSDKNDVSPEIAAKIIHNYLEDHYRRTIDDPLPFLDGKSPRKAVKSKKGRAQVVEWLKRLENSEHRRSKAEGQTPYDLTWMWNELNLKCDQ